MLLTKSEQFFHISAWLYLADTHPPSNRRCWRSSPSVSDTWSWHRRTVQHSTTVLFWWLHQERGMACLPQSEPLRHCRRFARNWRPFSSGPPVEFSVTYLGRSITDTVFSASVAYLYIDIVKCPCNVFRDSITLIGCFCKNNNNNNNNCLLACSNYTHET